MGDIKKTEYPVKELRIRGVFITNKIAVPGNEPVPVIFY